MRDRRGERTFSLHVRGYDQARTTAESLRARFLRFGHILDVYMPRDYYTKKPRGFCYIEFESDAEAEKAKVDTDRTVRGEKEDGDVEGGPRRGRGCCYASVLAIVGPLMLAFTTGRTWTQLAVQCDRRSVVGESVC